MSEEIGLPKGLIGSQITGMGMNDAGEIFLNTSAGEFVIAKDERGEVSLYEVLRRPLPGPNWQEDLRAPGGIYQNRCTSCGCTFFGHKRRTICKTCDHKAKT